MTHVGPNELPAADSAPTEPLVRNTVGIAPVVLKPTSTWSFGWDTVAVFGLLAVFVAFLLFQINVGSPSESPAPQAKSAPASNSTYFEKVNSINSKVANGEIALIAGVTTAELPTRQTLLPEHVSVTLEKSQTWWRNDSGDFWLHFHNTSPHELAGIGLNYAEQGCAVAGDEKQFFVTFAQPVVAGAQSVVKFKSAIGVGSKGTNCLVISSAWESKFQVPLASQQEGKDPRAVTALIDSAPTRPLPAPRPTATPEQAKGPTFTLQEQSDLNAISERAISDYPYLATPAGKVALEKIMARRDELIAKGVYPSIALTQAVNAFASAMAPKVTPEQKNATQLSSGNYGNHPGFDPKCRWVTPQDWSCK